MTILTCDCGYEIYIMDHVYLIKLKLPKIVEIIVLHVEDTIREDKELDYYD